MTEVPAQTELFISREIDENTLASFYLQLYQDGMLQELFYAGIPSISEVLAWRARPDILILGGFVNHVQPLNVNEKSGPELAGLGFVWDIGKLGVRRGDLGFVFLRKFQKRSITVPLARMMLRHLFVDLQLSVVYGVSAEQGYAAIALAKALGFQQTGPLPAYTNYHGEPTGAVISYMRAEDFLAQPEVKE